MIKLVSYFSFKSTSLIINKFFERKNNLNILNQKDSLDYLIDTKKSLIRWGDGESTIFAGGNINFQKNSYSLMYGFWKLVFNYNEKSNYALAVPKEVLETKNSILKKAKLWYLTKLIINIFFNKSTYYLDSMMFREDTQLTNLEIEKLWINFENIIFIHNNYKYYIDFKEKYLNSQVHFISVPSANSFEQWQLVMNKINTIKTSTNGDTCILISSGPSSKYIIHKLYNSNICYDMGHYFDYKFYDISRI